MPNFGCIVLEFDGFIIKIGLGSREINEAIEIK